MGIGREKQESFTDPSPFAHAVPCETQLTGTCTIVPALRGIFTKEGTARPVL